MTDIQRHTLADALHRLADLVAAGRLAEGAGFWHVAASGTYLAEDITAAMTGLAETPDPETGEPVWSGWLLGQLLYVRVLAVAPLEVAAAALTPDAEVAS